MNRVKPIKPWTELTVAVTGMNARPDNPGPGYAVARCLREAPEFTGRIVGLGYDALDPGVYDRQVCDQAYLMPYPSTGEAVLLDRLKHIHRRERIDVLIPCLDSELPGLSRLQPQLAEMGIRMFLPDIPQIQARNKDRLGDLCHPLGIATPETKNVTQANFFYQCEQQGWSYPLMIKGVFYDAAVAHTPKQAVAIFHRIASEWGFPVLAQRYVEGNEFNLTGLGDGKGNLVAPVMMRKRGLTDKGKAWAGVTIHDPHLLKTAETLVRALKWHGPLEVEMLRDKQGQYHLLEINPRFPAWIYLSHGVDRNLPTALLRVLQEGEAPATTPAKAGTLFIRYAQEMIVALEDLETMTMNGGRGPSDPDTRPEFRPTGGRPVLFLRLIRPRRTTMNAPIDLRKTWQTPVIKPHGMGTINKFGSGGLNRDLHTDNVDGVPVAQLIEQYGSPLFVTSEDTLRSNVRRLKRSFESRYPKVIHGWSYKTNYTSAICNILHQEGSWAEVVSAFEYEKARHLGVPGDRIIFNGPNKSHRILKRAIREGARLHMDHDDELSSIETIAQGQDRIVPVALRLNFDTGYTEPWNRFGFNLESGQAWEAVQRIARHPRLRLTGLHSHIGTFILDPRAYEAQVKIMGTFMERVESETDTIIETFDIGGGFASKNALQGIYLPPDEVVPDPDQYAETICDALREATRYREARGLPRPTLILESGRAVVDDAQVLLTSVVGVKRLPDGRQGLVLDAGVNTLFTGFWYNHEVRLTRPSQGMAEETVLYGPLCMNIDVVRKSIALPPLAVGDTLLIGPVGAYNNTQWMQFIEYRPNVVLVHGGGQGMTSIVRDAEDLAVMTAQDRLPPHLASPFRS